MSYVLSVIHPPENGAAYGKAVVLAPHPYLGSGVKRQAEVVLLKSGAPGGEAEEFSLMLSMQNIGTEVKHDPTGLTFRIDLADNAPHPCPCGKDDPDGCGRLVLPTDHAFATMEDAVCSGCWGDTVNTGCLPENTAHPAEEG